MIKKILTDTEYTITSNKTISIKNTISFTAKNLSLILVTSSNKIVYNFACDDKRATVSNNIITLVDNTISLTDKLTIILSYSDEEQTEKLNDISVLNYKIESILNDILEEQRITNKYLKKIYNPE